MAHDQASKDMPFLDHLEELRWRLLWSLAAFIIGVVVSFVLLTKFDVIGILVVVGVVLVMF